MKIKLNELVGKIVCKTELNIPDNSGQYPRLHWVHENNLRIKKKDVVYQYVNIEDTPHIEFVKGNKTSYREYMNTSGWTKGYGPERKKACENFQRLIDTFEEYDPRVKSIEVVKENNKYAIVDGLHRCSILYTRDHEQEIDVNVITCPAFTNLRMAKN